MAGCDVWFRGWPCSQPEILLYKQQIDMLKTELLDKDANESGLKYVWRLVAHMCAHAQANWSTITYAHIVEYSLMAYYMDGENQVCGCFNTNVNINNQTNNTT